MSTATSSGVRRVLASGGAVDQVTTLDASAKEISHLWPEFLPDGRHFLYLATRVGVSSAIYVASLDGGTPKRLMESDYMVRVAPPDRLLFVQGDSLVTQRFDLDRLQLMGEPELVVNGILRTTGGRVAASASRTGVLVYGAGTGGSALSTIMLDRSGRVLPVPSLPQNVASGVRLSPDGRHLAFLRGINQFRMPTELWLFDMERHVETRLATEAGGITTPQFSRDGAQLYFGTQGESGASSIVSQPVSGAAATAIELGLNDGAGRQPTVVAASLDHRQLVFSRYIGYGIGSQGLWTVPTAGAAKPVEYLPNAPVLGADLSPDGRWLAYAMASSSADVAQVFIQPFPDPGGGKLAASGLGARSPRWRRDGRELFFWHQGRIMSVPVASTPRLSVGQATALFDYSPDGGVSFDVSSDGQRFVVGSRFTTTAPLTVAVNWTAGLKK